MKNALRLLLTLFTILCCTTIIGASIQETHSGVVFGKACVNEGEIGFCADFNAPKRLPTKATDTLAHIKKTGNAPAGYKGGRTFRNDGRGGGQTLPSKDAGGNSITYKEYDVNPFQKGVNRGTERVVRGSDGKAYYTSDHYNTFTPIE